MKPCILVTGTGTDVGKTVVSSLMLRRARERGLRPAGFKPLCSGGRGDAESLRSAAGGVLSLDVVNPWHFAEPLAPAIAAELAGVRIPIRRIAAHVRKHGGKDGWVLVEAAGGLLSPLASDGDAPELLRALRALPVVVAVDRLGVIHDVRAVLAALGPQDAERVRLVLVDPVRRDPSCLHNGSFLEAVVGPERLFRIPRLTRGWERRAALAEVSAELDRLLDSLSLWRR